MPVYRRIVQSGDPGTGGVSAGDLASAVALLQDKATAATDTELAAAVTTINNTLTGKQDSSTAATDAELAAAVATLQSSATAATDAELAAAVSTINTALGLKQDAATAATDAELATEATARAAETTRATAAEAANAANIATNTTAVATKQDAATAATDAELAAAIAAAKGEIASMPWSLSTVAAAGADTAVSGWQIVVPANSGPITLKVSNMLWSLITGTLASGTQQYCAAAIKDEAGVVVGYAKWQVIATGVTQTQVNTFTVEGDLPNNVAAKTYSVWLRCAHTDLGSSATFFASGSGFIDPVLKALRR